MESPKQIVARLPVYAQIVLAFSSLLWLTACGPDYPEPVVDALASIPERIDYNFHVKPILSDRCFACHGPDAQNQQAGLRLDNARGAYAALASGNGYAIVPGQAASSQLVHRIISDDPQMVMPTPESRLTLTDREKAILIRWIEQGAEYKDHWAFVAPVAPPVPDAAEHPVDAFVRDRLQRKGIEPAPEADRPTLIRRLFFDLTGLPPQLDELDRWLADDAPDWYERLVDELLNRPTYGERMANYWMDVARFADSEGYLDDFHHALWPYRDWVIKAYNENLPHNDFIEWQVAGDLLPNATQEQILATTFNRNHKQNSEGGIIPEEFRVEYVADRANTVGTAFLGLTVGCARCHDHKYDPISQKDYYSLFAFFNNTIERGDAISSGNAVENGQRVSNYLSMNAGPTLPLADSATTAVREHLLALIAEREGEITRKEEAVLQTAEVGPTEGELKRYVRSKTVHHLTFDGPKIEDTAPGGKVRYAHLEREAGRVGQGLLCRSGRLSVEGERSAFERSDPFTVSFWIKVPQFYEEAHFLYNSNHRIQGYRGWDVVLDSNRVHFRLNHAHPYQSIDLRVGDSLRVGEWTHFVWSYDGSSRADGMRIYRNGQQIEPEIIRDHLLRSTKPYPTLEGSIYMMYEGLVLGSRFYDEDMAGGWLDELQILNVEAGELIAEYLYKAPLGKATIGSAAARREYELLHQNEELTVAREQLRELRAREVTTIDTVREIMVMGDDTRLRPTYILERGVYDAHGQPVNPDVPASLLPWPDTLPRNRLGLAYWLTHPDNPLTARIAVNQYWYLVFGRGLVESVGDFGNQGALPSHPELLDWLATDFQDNDWNVKWLLRLLVTSATYRQSSVIRPELADIDPDNYLLARGTRYRRDAEMVRDNLLAASGLLDPSVGGASVFPYQPPGLWREVSSHAFSPAYQIDYQEGLYRRSLYTFWKRNMPPPNMLIFDAATRAECQVRRQRSNTPLQALVLLNDEQVIEACRVLAQNAYRSTDGVGEKAVQNVFRRLIGREPTGAEYTIMLEQLGAEAEYFRSVPERATAYLGVGNRPYDRQLPVAELAALARVANTVLNTTESHYKN